MLSSFHLIVSSFTQTEPHALHMSISFPVRLIPLHVFALTKIHSCTDLVVPALCIIAIVLRIFSWIISAIFQCATLVIYVLCIVFHCLVFVQRVEKQKLSNEVYSAPLIALGAGLALQLLMLVETVARSRLESKYGHQKFIDESERNYRLHMKLYGLEEKDADI